MVLSMAVRYFSSEPSRVQMIGFLIIFNSKVNELYQLLYNDSFVEFCIFAAIYSLASLNRPIVASMLLSLAISIKTGAILLLPCLLGWIQYSNGTLSLLASVITIMSIQIVLAAPFVSPAAAVMMGWPNASSSLYMYLIRSKFIPSTEKFRRFGSQPSFSHWWTWIDEDMYFKDAWLEFLQKVILFINVYYFFIRRNCMPKCLSQLWNTFSPQKCDTSHKLKDLRLCVELLVIAYLSGLAFLPGGHRQFFIWFVQLIPLAFMMIGFEPLVYANWYALVWNFRHANRAIGHILHILICLYLLTIGPDALRSVQNSVKRCLSKTFLPQVKKRKLKTY